MSSPIESSSTYFAGHSTYPDINHPSKRKPVVSHDEDMLEVYSTSNSDDENLTWEGKDLNICITYGGGCKHKIDAHILDTSSDGARSYTIHLSVHNHDDPREKLICDEVLLDLSEYAISGTKFMVLNGGSKVGETTFE
ncbi:MAG: hypothetical protein AAGG81_08000 [Chlamydiota bacterium]